MKRIFITLFIIALVLSSCSFSNKVATPVSFDPPETLSTDVTIEGNQALYSGLSYSGTGIDAEIIDINGTAVVCPTLPNDELNEQLRSMLADYLSVLDLPFSPRLIDFDTFDAFNARTFSFYISDSSDLYNYKNVSFSYNLETLTKSSISDYFSDIALPRILYEVCNDPDAVIETFFVSDDGFYFTSDNTEYFISSLYLNEEDVFTVFHPNDYYPVIDKNEKYVALTFDDGPNPYTTTKLVNMLNDKGVKATFFMLGYNIEEYKYIVNKIYKSGHDIGIHSYKHDNFSLMKSDDIISDIDKCANLVYSIIGKRPYLVRPPYGAVDMKKLSDTDYFFVNWNVDPADWKLDSAQEIADEAIKYVRPGSIILLHDIYKASCDAAEIIVDTLLEKGYRFVTISEYFNLNGKKADNKLHFYLEDYNVE